MSLIDLVLKKIEENRTKKTNSLSIHDKFPRFSEYLPGILKGKYYGVTGAPSAAKTQFTDFTFLYHPIDFAKVNKIELEIVYFSFEISKQSKLLQGISRRLFLEYGLRLPPSILEKHGNIGLTDEQSEKVAKVANYFRNIEPYVTFYDEPLTPTQIYNIQLKKLKENGSFDEIKSIYTPDNPDKYIIFIIDHISLIQPEQGQSLHQALTMYSNNNIFLRNKFNATIVNIHQQGTEGQVEQFTSKGDNISAKLEPKLAGLADNRTLGRDYDIVLGLFSPKKFEIDFHRGYKTKKFGDKCRFLSIIKNREGEQDKSIALYFDGAVGYFEELPKTENFVITKMGQKVDNDELYEKYIKGHVGILDPNKTKLFTFL